MSAGEPRRNRSSVYTGEVRPGEGPEPEVGDDGRTGSVVVRERVGPCAPKRALVQPLSSAARHPPPLRVQVAE